jgi:hypothetical protein
MRTSPYVGNLVGNRGLRTGGAVVTVRIASTRRSETHGLKKPYKTLTNHSSASHNHALYYGRTEFYEEQQVKDLHIFFIGLSYTDAIVMDNNEV